METFDMSDGEIVEDLSEISSEEGDYFEHLKKLSERKLELEIENSLVLGQFAEKENRYSNHRKRFRPSPPKKKRLSSHSDSSRDIQRARSYRASSVFSNYPIPKRRKSERWRANQKATRSSRKERRPRSKQEVGEFIGEREEKRVIRIDDNSDDASSDEELLELRLNALKSKQEVKELINDENVLESPEPQIEATSSGLTAEENDLRILALKSTLIKKRNSILERKKRKMLENERPYSPSDDVTPLALDDDPMILSPLGSPFNEINEEIDMDISNSPRQLNEEKESSDMDIVGSPNGVVAETEDDANDEEISLRSMLLCSITTKKMTEKIRSPTPETPPDSGTESSIAMNLKLAVQRIKQKQQSKSGSKTIAMVLAENASKESIKKEAEVESEMTVEENTTVQSDETVSEIPLDVTVQAENFIRTIRNDLEKSVADNLQAVALDSQPKSPQTEADTSFSTITDTKNIPLVRGNDKTQKSRLITSLVKRVVSPLVITVNTGSDSEDDTRLVTLKKTALQKKPDGKSATKTPNDIESFLKSIRLQHENAGKEKTTNEMKPPAKVQLTQPKSSLSSPATKSFSSVKHLPISSQIEYEKLVQKMRVLEAKQKARMVKQKAKQPAAVAASPVPAKPVQSTPKLAETKQSDKIAESLRKIPQLNETAQQSILTKAENNYLKHSSVLIEATRQSISLLENSRKDVKKQQQTSLLIATLEKKLLAAKSSLNSVNHQVKTNAHKIVQSHREIIKLNGNKERFGKICQQVGVLKNGDQYSLPNANASELVENFKQIVDKTEEISKASNEQIAKTHLHFVAERIKSFIVEIPTTLQSKPTVADAVAIETPCAKETSQLDASAINPAASDETPVDQTVDDDKDSAVSKLINESSEGLEEVPDASIVIEEKPEFQKQSKLTLDGNVELYKRRLSPLNGKAVEKKLKYESPLEFLRVPKNKTSSLNKIICPYHLEGTCSDDKCQMTHI